MPTVRIWDLPTRLFHWLLALCTAGLIVSGSVGGAWMEWHLRLGYTVATLLLFRLVWGFIGGHWSRFGRFLYGPAAVWQHVRGRSPLHHRVGHNPLGALSVFALLAVLVVQVGTGLMSDDEIATFGPLVRFVSPDTVASATGYHKAVGKLIVIALIALHLLAIGVYKLVKREPLTQAMITGDKQLPEPVPGARDGLAQRLLALAVLTACGLLVWWVVRLGYSTA